MVKVHDEDTLSESSPGSGLPSGDTQVTMPAPARHRFTSPNHNNNNNSHTVNNNHNNHNTSGGNCHLHNNNHGHQVVHNTKVTNNVATQHFHYHWSYPTQAGPLPPNSAPATFHFGQGFEPQTSPQQHVVHFHVNPGVTVSFQMGDNVQVIKGPVTVPMVSTNSSPPIAMPVQVPHGHVVQQIVDESGTLRHVILSPQHPPLVPLPPHFGAGSAGGSNPPQPFFPTGLPPGFPAFPHGNPLQQGVLPSHLPPTQQGHSPPPGINFHKDERSQKQYNKKKKNK
uniref:Fibronectin type III domain-containing protein 3B n=1 Tax=Cacopsylla melanoneura TaxID=428564 RepID=A0A8D9EJY1_9HEMI